MPHKYQHVTVVLLAALVAFPAPSVAASSTNNAKPHVLVVAPIADGDLDSESENIANAVGLALAQTTSHHIVDSKLAARVLDYYNDTDEPAPSALAGAQKEISEAKEKFFSFHYDDAAAKLDRAISILKGADDLSATGAALADANVSRALIAKSRGDENAARDAIASVLRIDPTFELDPQSYPPSLIATFNSVKGALAATPRGAVKITTTPPAADVYLNGIKKGVTPIEIKDLPEGSYSLAIEANRYEKILRSVDVKNDARVEIKEKLKWAKNSAEKNGGKKSRFDESAAEVKEGIRIAKLVRADKAVLVDVDAADGGKKVTARVVDAAFGAGMAAIVLNLDAKSSEGSWRSEGLAALVGRISSQTSADLASYPSRKIDPKGVADPILLAKQKRNVTASPVFWWVVGALAAGAIGGGVAAAMDGGGSNGPGSLRVEFR